MVDERDDWQAMAADPQFKWRDGMLALRWAPGLRDHLRPECRWSCVIDGIGATPDRTDRPTVGAVQGMAEAWCREHGYWISWILDNKATVEIEDELDTKFCCPCDDLATVAARALRWCWAQEVGDE
jgi:hypothetical protein